MPTFAVCPHFCGFTFIILHFAVSSGRAPAGRAIRSHLPAVGTATIPHATAVFKLV